MTRKEIFDEICKKETFLCVGLDSDLRRIPECLLRESNPIAVFNRAIIDATAPYCVAYKPNLAFYEAAGVQGWLALQDTIDYLHRFYPEKFVIADAKRGDIGNTAELYARTFFDELDVDALTVAPYMGSDSVKPFLGFDDKFVILLALTSNPGSHDFQHLNVGDKELYQQVLATSKTWGGPDEIMYVVGATQAQALKDVRALVPDNFLLVPGVGAQGGSLREVTLNGMNDQCGLLVNSSRGIIFASTSGDFTQAAAKAAQKLQQEMAQYLHQRFD